MNDRQTLREWIGDRVAYDLALRRAAYDDRNVEVLSATSPDTCQVSVSVVLDTLGRSWALRLRAETHITVVELEQLHQWSIHAGRRKLSAIGVADRQSASQSARSPNGWGHLPPEATEAARQAAVLDAADRVLADCHNLRVGMAETLGGVFDVYPKFEDAFREALERVTAGHGTAVFEPYGICRFPATFERTDLTTLLVQTANRLPEDQKPPNVDFTQLTDPQRRKSITAEGLGIAPPTRLTWPAKVATIAAPGWVREQLTAVGRSQPSEKEPSDSGISEEARKAAVTEAQNDAIDNMWFQVGELMLPNKKRVNDLLLAYPALVKDLSALEERMRTVCQVEVDANGRAIVKITIPLAPIWDIVKRVMPAATSAPAAK